MTILTKGPELLEEARSGDSIAMLALLHGYRRRLLDYINRHLPPAVAREVDPEDVMQDTCMEACRRIKEFSPRGEDSMLRWLMTMARHHMIDLLRTQTRQKRGGGRWARIERTDDDSGVQALLESLAVYRRTPSQSAAAHELTIALERTIDTLPDDCRQAIRLRHLEGVSAKDAASRMNRTEGAFHSLCHRGLVQLKEGLRSRSIYV
jgi:RNA polymerase sigma-70 factor (ECF subfamily)